jgi:predicted transcriptional regulator
MRDRGFIEDIQAKRAIDLIEKHKNQKLVTVNENDLVEQAFTIMNKYDISHFPWLMIKAYLPVHSMTTTFLPVWCSRMS